MKRCPYCAEEIQDAAVKCKHCSCMLDGSGRASAAANGQRKLTRSRTDRMLSGVCGGLAAYASMDPILVRLLVVVGIFVTGIVPGIIAYVVAAMVIPEEM
jgi:phage shock protein C